MGLVNFANVKFVPFTAWFIVKVKEEKLKNVFKETEMNNSKPITAKLK